GLRNGCQTADIRAALLLGHELRALREAAHVRLGQTIEVFGLERLVTVAREQHGRAVRHIERTAHAELGLVEEIGEGVLRRSRICAGPTQNSLPMRHGVDAERAEADPLELPI